MNNIDVSIIFVNFNTIMLLKDAIDSVIEKTIGINYEIIIVDNNSSDNSKNIISKRYKDIIYISLPENIGFGRANNEGLKIAKGRNILFLNPDTKLLNNAINYMSNYLDSNVKVGACGGNLFDEEMKPVHSFKRLLPSVLYEISFLLNNIPEKLFYGANRDFNFKKNPLEVAYITGADLMVKKNVLDKVGIFDPDFFMYYEETELCWRIQRKGLKIINIPYAHIQHLEGASFDEKKTNSKRMKMMESSRNLYYKKTHSIFYHLVANLFYSLSIRIRILIFEFINKNKSNYWKERLNIIAN